MVALATIYIPWIFVIEHGPQVYSGGQLNMRMERDLKEQFGERVSKQVHFHFHFYFHFDCCFHFHLPFC